MKVEGEFSEIENEIKGNRRPQPVHDPQKKTGLQWAHYRGPAGPQALVSGRKKRTWRCGRGRPLSLAPRSPGPHPLVTGPSLPLEPPYRSPLFFFTYTRRSPLFSPTRAEVADVRSRRKQSPFSPSMSQPLSRTESTPFFLPPIEPALGTPRVLRQ